MKLGTQTASLTNHLYSRMTIGQPDPVVGMGATVLCWTDRHAATVTALLNSSGTIIVVREDYARRIDKNGMSESQEYEYSRNTEGRRYIFRKGAHGDWQQIEINSKTQRWNKVEGPGLRIGEREEYHDFSF